MVWRRGGVRGLRGRGWFVEVLSLYVYNPGLVKSIVDGYGLHVVTVEYRERYILSDNTISMTSAFAISNKPLRALADPIYLPPSVVIVDLSTPNPASPHPPTVSTQPNLEKKKNHTSRPRIPFTLPQACIQAAKTGNHQPKAKSTGWEFRTPDLSRVSRM